MTRRCWPWGHQWTLWAKVRMAAYSDFHRRTFQLSREFRSCNICGTIQHRRPR